MADRARSEFPDGNARAHRAPAPSSSAGPRVAAQAPANAIALQRMVGNRAATRILTRWAAHPDKDKKGQFMTDQNAAEWNRLNPPLSK